MGTVTDSMIVSGHLDSPLGLIRISATAGAICEVHFVKEQRKDANEINSTDTNMYLGPNDYIQADKYPDSKNYTYTGQYPDSKNYTYTDKYSDLKNYTQDDKLTAASGLIVKCKNQLIEYFEGKRRVFDFRTWQPGTEFQQKVWRQLSAIHYGDTISYMTLAKNLGDHKVIRAAGSANGKNNIAIVIPCHRVIGSGGDLVGFAGGLWRKKWLLDHEMKFARGVRTLF